MRRYITQDNMMAVGAVILIFICFFMANACAPAGADLPPDGRVCLLTPEGEAQTDNMTIVAVGRRDFEDGTSARGPLTVLSVQSGCFIVMGGSQQGVDISVLKSPCWRADEAIGIDLREPFTKSLVPDSGVTCRRSDNGQHYPLCSQYVSYMESNALFGKCANEPPEACENDPDLGGCCAELLSGCCGDPQISANQPQGADACGELGF